MTTLQIATYASALAWPLAAGVAIVFWSRSRAAAHARRVAAMETELQAMYQAVEGAPAPAHLIMVVDALEEGELLASPRSRAAQKLATSSRS